jgi:hypothetical protein
MLRSEKIGWSLVAPDITSMVYQAVKEQASCEKPDAVLNIETHLFDVILCANSCEYDLDVGHELHLNVGRWSRLIREYVPREPWERFRDQAVEILKGDARQGATANMMFRDPKRHAKKHRWGGCLMGATFRMGPSNYLGTLTFYSRTTYIGYMGILDAAIASVMAQEIGGLCLWVADPRKFIRFQWHIASMQLHAFKTLPYIYRKPALNSHLEKLVRNRRLIPNQPPFWKHAAKWQCQVVDRLGSEGLAGMRREKYGPLKRVMRRWYETQQLISGAKSDTIIPPSLPVSSLTLDKAE